MTVSNGLPSGASTVERAPDLTSAAPTARSRPWLQALVPVALVAVMAVLGLVLQADPLLTLDEVLALVVFATATNLLLGGGGLVSFGQAVFYGVGAYTVALGWLHWQLGFWVTFFLAPF